MPTEPPDSAVLAPIAVGIGAIAVRWSSLVVLVAIVLVAMLAAVIAPYDPLAQSFLRINQPPSAEHWLGTDQFGRDVLSRMIYGSRNSLIFGPARPALAAIFGTTLGVAAGYFGGISTGIIAGSSTCCSPSRSCCSRS